METYHLFFTFITTWPGTQRETLAVLLSHVVVLLRGDEPNSFQTPTGDLVFLHPRTEMQVNTVQP